MGVLDGSNLCPAVLAVLIFWAIGSRMVEHRPDLHQWGLRIGAGAFLASLAVGWAEDSPSDAQDWLPLLLTSLSLGGLSVGIAWISLAILSFMWGRTIGRVLSVSGGAYRRIRRQREDRVTHRAEQRRQSLARAAYEQAAPERERLRLQAEDEAKALTLAQERRSDARASALLSFSYYSAKLGNRFSREMFDHYVAEYMGDERPSEAVERCGKELIAIFERHLADVQPPRKSASIASLTKWYEETRAQIEALPLDEEIKEPRLIDLKRRFDELLAAHLEGTEP